MAEVLENNASTTSLIEQSTSTYRGDFNDEHQKQGKGYQNWVKNYLQKYYGRFLRDSLHNEGTYSQIKTGNSYYYEGSLYANDFEGYARVVMDNRTYFEGLFRRNKRYGPGVVTYENGAQDVGLWDGLSLMRLSQVVLPEWIPTLGITSLGKAKLLRYKKLVRVCDENEDKAKEVLRRLTSNEDVINESSKLYNTRVRNRDSLFFDKPSHDKDYFREVDCCIDVVISDEEMSEELQDFEGTEDGAINAIVVDSLEALLNNMKRLQELTPVEVDLMELKTTILGKLCKQAMYRRNILGDEEVKIPTRKVRVTELLAWNNEKASMEMLRYTFTHRNREEIVNFSVTKLLTSSRQSFNDPGEYESACVAFLAGCSEGRELEVSEIFYNYNINPDLSDAKGNTGILYASARDRVPLIKNLTQLGANLDVLNDEGLTPLSMCLLRYIAVLKDVRNWETAFIVDSEGSEAQDVVNAWCPRTSFINFVSHSFLDTISYCQSVFFKGDNHLFMHRTDERDNEDFLWLYETLNLVRPTSETQVFQQPYESGAAHDNYVFSLDLVKPSMMKKKNKGKGGKDKQSKGSKGTKSSKKNNIKSPTVKRSVLTVRDPLYDKLDVINNTILVLLYYGADPNIGEVPLPQVALTLFTENVGILENLIKSGADLNITIGPDQLTMLHVLVSLRATELLVKFCKVILDHNVNPNRRTHPNHWSNERNGIIGDYKLPVEDIGKTALHILCMRLDFDLDPSGYLNEVAKMIVANHGSLVEKYLGHTPLSLAVLRGNINLVQTLLAIGANPNGRLEENMGNPLTVYALKRYAKYIPDVVDCKIIMDLLVQFFGNPLLEVYEFGNAVEFMRSESVEVKKPKKKAKKKQKKSKQDDLNEYLVTLARDVALRHYQMKALMLLFHSVIRGETENNFCKNVANLLTVDETLRLIKLLIDKNLLDTRSKIQSFAVSMLVSYVAQNGYKPKNPKGKEQNLVELDELLVPSCKERRPGTWKEFELDRNEEIYQICFECCFRKDKVLLACPKCGLVHFCSQECNKSSLKRRNNRHTCNVLFYNDERKRYDECLALGIPYVSEAARNFDRFADVGGFFGALTKELRQVEENDDLARRFFEKHGEDYLAVGEHGAKKKGYDGGSSDYDTGSSRTGTKGRFGRSQSQTGTKGRSGRSDSRTGTKGRSGRSGASGGGKSGGKTRDGKGGGKRSTKGSRDGREKSGGKDGGSQRTGDQRKSIRSAKTDKTAAKAQRVKLEALAAINAAKRLAEQSGDKQQTSTVRPQVQAISFDDNSLLEEGDTGRNYFAGLSRQHQQFMQKMAELFPDFDLGAMFLPYVCFREGQLYYRFTDEGRPAIFCNTYTAT